MLLIGAVVLEQCLEVSNVDDEEEDENNGDDCRVGEYNDNFRGDDDDGIDDDNTAADYGSDYD